MTQKESEASLGVSALEDSGFTWAHSLNHLVPKLMSVKNEAYGDLIEEGMLLVGQHDKLIYEVEEMKLAIVAEKLLRSGCFTPIESESISFIYASSSVVQGLISIGISSNAAIKILADVKNLIFPLLELNSIQSLDNLVLEISKNLNYLSLPQIDFSRLDESISRCYYQFLSLISRESINAYINSAQYAKKESNNSKEYISRILELERGIRAPSFAMKPEAIVEIDRNGYRIRVFTGKQLSKEEKRILSAYRFCQYADPRIDHDKMKGDQADIPFFDSVAAYEIGLFSEPDIVFTDSPYEYHVVISEPDGRIVGYVGLEEPLSTNNSDVKFGDIRTEEQLYGLERAFGSDVLVNLTNGELANEPINTAADIVRLTPRANTDADDQLKNSDKIIIAFELSNALTKIIDRLISEGRKYAICDTELEKLLQVFAGLLGIMPVFTNAEEVHPDPDNLPYPYNKLLRTRYVDTLERKRTVSVVAFELSILNSPSLLERRGEVESLLEEYAKTHDALEKKSVISKIKAYAEEHIMQTSLGRGLIPVENTYDPDKHILEV